ncbi:MAG: histidinol-phosphatase [Pseudomonadota bacterium]
MTPLPENTLALAERLAEAARQAVLVHFRIPDLTADNKATSGYDPVTVADRASEAAMRAILAAERPEDGILGEEEAPRASRSGLTWVLDPIDGTRAFIAGLPLWGVLIGLDDGSRGRLGVIDQPYIGERFAGMLQNDGTRTAWFERAGVRHEIATRPCAGLSEAVLFTTDPALFTAREGAGFAKVRARAQLTRYGTDCYAYALVAAGLADLVVEAGLARYDIAAPAALVEAAGGIVTDWQGGDARFGGRVIAAGDARVHAEALAILSELD